MKTNYFKLSTYKNKKKLKSGLSLLSKYNKFYEIFLNLPKKRSKKTKCGLMRYTYKKKCIATCFMFII